MEYIEGVWGQTEIKLIKEDNLNITQGSNIVQLEQCQIGPFALHEQTDINPLELD